MQCWLAGTGAIRRDCRHQFLWRHPLRPRERAIRWAGACGFRNGERYALLRAFELVVTRRNKVTAVHKANSFHMSDGLFLECVRHVAAQFPQVELDDLLIDAATAHLVGTQGFGRKVAAAL